MLDGMTWKTDDGAHESYILPEFADGVRGLGITSNKVEWDEVIVQVEYPEDGEIDYLVRPAAEVVGWRLVCDCIDDPELDGRPSHQWIGPLIVRVPSKALEDVAAGRIYAPDDHVPDVNENDDEDRLAPLELQWRREHVDNLEELTRLRRIRSHLRAADVELEEAVMAARAAGFSWEAIGANLGMTRQSAHGRWGGQ